jgi:hypothetical protein
MSELRQIINTVGSIKGLGESGKRVSILEEDCEKCGYDRQIKIEYINPTFGTDAVKKCMNPVCVDYHDGKFLHP